MDLSLANTNLFTKGILLKGFFIPKILNSPLASFSLININFLVSHTTHFDKIISFPIFAFATPGFLLHVFLYTLRNMIAFFYKQSKILDEVLNSLNFLFLLSYYHILLTHY